jgi:hypothetical protein
MSVGERTRSRLYERAHGCCESCGQYGATNAHHRQNRSQGGPDTLSNLLLLCGSGTTGCHGYITQSPEMAQVRGYTVRSGENPADVPVQRWDRERGYAAWVLLDNDGGLTYTLDDGVAS